MVLDEFTDPTIQVVFLCKTFDLKSIDIPAQMYDDAWYRVQNETTS